MYKGKFASELSINEVKEYYDELRRKFPRTEDQWADFNILQEKLIAFAYKILDGKINGDVIKAIQKQAESEDRMKKYIELTEYDSNGRTVVFADSIQGLCRIHDEEYNKEFTMVIASSYTFMVNEPIDEILEKMASIAVDMKDKEVDDVFDKIKGYVEHIRNTGMGKKKSLGFIEKFIEGLKTEIY